MHRCATRLSCCSTSLFELCYLNALVHSLWNSCTVVSVVISFLLSLCYCFGCTSWVSPLPQSLLVPEHGVDLSQDQQQLHPILAHLFAFAYIWGLGGNLTHHCHPPFNAFVRSQLSSLLHLPPGASVFDFFVDVKKDAQGAAVSALQQWSAVLPAPAGRKHLPYFQMLVPTVDTVRYSYLLQVGNPHVARSTFLVINKWHSPYPGPDCYSAFLCSVCLCLKSGASSCRS